MYSKLGPSQEAFYLPFIQDLLIRYNTKRGGRGELKFKATQHLIGVI